MFFIPIRSTSLAHYINHLLILPAKYLKYKVSDIQDINESHLLISKKDKWINDSNVSIEIELMKKEINQIQKISNNIYLTNKILPISRIKKIWFLSDEQKNTTIGNIKLSTGFIPQTLLDVDKNPIAIETKISKNKSKTKDYRWNINIFDKYMGGISILKNFQDFKVLLNYFDDSKKHLELKSNLIGFFENKSNWTNIRNIILNREISEDDLFQITKKEKQPFEKFLDILLTDNISKNTWSYIYAMLYKHRFITQDNLYNLIDEIKSLNNNSKYVGIIFLYGIMLGYSRRYVSIEANNHKFEKIKLEEINEFKLIESIYMLLFEKKISKEIRLKKMANMDFNKLDFSFMQEIFLVSKQTIQNDIKKVISENKKISFKEKIDLLKNLGLKLSKKFRILELTKLLEKSEFTVKELANNLFISTTTVTNDLKEINANRKRVGKSYIYSLKNFV
jgi:hypothetical protein